MHVYIHTYQQYKVLCRNPKASVALWFVCVFEGCLEAIVRRADDGGAFLTGYVPGPAPKTRIFVVDVVVACTRHYFNIRLVAFPVGW